MILSQLPSMENSLGYSPTTFESFDVTPVIGREFVGVDLSNLLRAPNSDELIRDLAITISRRGVVFFRKQDNLTDDLQKELVQRLGEQSGKPATTRRVTTPARTTRSASFRPNRRRSCFLAAMPASASELSAKPIPSDYALLRLTQLPETGGDTLWASGYELYDRISPTLQRFLDTLTAKYAQPQFNQAAKENNFSIYSAQRGAPENVGEVLEAVHPVVRTNPVTGWKSIFAVGQHVERIHGLSETENRHFLDWFIDLINANDVAIWDNGSVYHAATPDYMFEQGLGERYGVRAVSLGEKPYFDPQSTGRRESLEKETQEAAVPEVSA
ncbi:uncharacterized protein NECHADRAFT_98371 [Fusarium vanettenii 77-13-4]|uniref:TauD/TfdA-like domain-containing protein n=1 Tax=Fusarium vanettenii (strain ATCC MYA-4622 / CBS 123669 / FGSC 9596 / NRRL 45880 / 77-13-4) TaxID=660122 RepID=C7ZQL7_FUSV7|nr:uncharacterized protein NECHADRAFT_98371 [Fusarium vanettenii 77-13-4]EEU33690.1 hypothetical protein NECHADRAFT_98371 [Fusarium vanettenii 77-13-4]